MKEILVSNFKAHCASILNEVATGGPEVVVTRRGKPLVRVVAASDTVGSERKLGDSTTTARITGDIVGTEGSSEWESWEA